MGKCTNCDQTVSETDKEGITRGLQATVKGVVVDVDDSNTPANIQVLEVLQSFVGCEPGTVKIRS